MKLHYKKLGEGQPLVILHGLFGSGDNWQTLGKKFADNYTVYLVDQRNHGHSPHAATHTYHDMADDLLELFREEYLTDVILLGHSMGGKTAMHFAQENPHLLAKLIVVDIGVKEYPMHHQLILQGLNAVDFTEVKSRGQADKKMSEYIQDFGVKQFLLKNLFWREKGVLDWRINLAVLEREMDEVLSEVPQITTEVETLFVRGEKSNYILQDDYESIKMIFPKAKIETINGAGHWIHAEAPKEFYNLVLEFIKQ